MVNILCVSIHYLYLILYIITLHSYIHHLFLDGFKWIDKAVKLPLTAYKKEETLLHTGKVSVKKGFGK